MSTLLEWQLKVRLLTLNPLVQFTQSGSIFCTVTMDKLSDNIWNGSDLGIENDERRYQKHMVTIGVKDTGIGIKPEQLSRLFKPFFQADSSTTR